MLSPIFRVYAVAACPALREFDLQNDLETMLGFKHWQVG